MYKGIMSKTEPWDNDLIQFARLLSEINYTHDLDLKVLRESMDLTNDDLFALFQRADKVWQSAIHCMGLQSIEPEDATD